MAGAPESRLTAPGPNRGYLLMVTALVLVAAGVALVARRLSSPEWLLPLLGVLLVATGVYAFLAGIRKVRVQRPRASADTFLQQVDAAGLGVRVCIGDRVIVPELGKCPVCEGAEQPFRVATENDRRVLESVVRSEQ